MSDSFSGNSQSYIPTIESELLRITSELREDYRKRGIPVMEGRKLTPKELEQLERQHHEVRSYIEWFDQLVKYSKEHPLSLD